MMTSEWTYKAVYNLKIQMEKCTTEHKRLIDKKDRVETIVDNLRSMNASEEQITEVRLVKSLVVIDLNVFFILRF